MHVLVNLFYEKLNFIHKFIELNLVQDLYLFFYIHVYKMHAFFLIQIFLIKDLIQQNHLNSFNKNLLAYKRDKLMLFSF